MLSNCCTGEDSWKSFGLKKVKQVNSKQNQPWIFIGRTDAKAELPILWPPDAKSQLIWKDPDAGKDWRQKSKGVIEDKMVGWHHWPNGHEFEQTLGDSEGQGNLVCCSSWEWQRVRHDLVAQQQQIPNPYVVHLKLALCVNHTSILCVHI